VIDFNIEKEQKRGLIIIFALTVGIAGFYFFNSRPSMQPALVPDLNSGMVQELISNSGDLVPVDVLKVSHHGSNYQYLPMLDLLKPKVALISVGARNKYGHPSLDLITQLKRRQISVWRTDQSGGLALASPNKIRVTGKEWWQIRWG
jgi:beta-lactamase superfamily II metal-dependent hydrolase